MKDQRDILNNGVTTNLGDKSTVVYWKIIVLIFWKLISVAVKTKGELYRQMSNFM